MAPHSQRAGSRRRQPLRKGGALQGSGVHPGRLGFLADARPLRPGQTISLLSTGVRGVTVLESPPASAPTEKALVPG